MLRDVMQVRRSIRKFRPDPVPDHILEQMAAAAAYAPSASNKQPWRFLIVRDRRRIRSAAEAVAAECRRITEKLRPEVREHFSRYAEKFTFFQNAPAVILPLFRVFSNIMAGSGATSDVKMENTFLELERHNSLMGVSMAIQNLQLRGHELGIGSCCMTGPLMAEKALMKHFDMPDVWRMAAVIAVGFPAEIPESPGRKPLGHIIRWL